MEVLIGLLIIAVGSFCQSSSYVPIKKVREWSWESFWLTQGVFAWLIFPVLGALLAVLCGMLQGEAIFWLRTQARSHLQNHSTVPGPETMKE